MSEQTIKTVKSEAEIKIQKEDIEQVIKTTSILTQDITFTLDTEGLTVRTMDSQHIALIDISMPNTMFEKYEVEQEISFTISSNDILKMIKMFDKQSWITLNITKDFECVLSNRTEKYTLKISDTSKPDVPLPKIPFDSRIEFSENQEVSTKDLLKQLEKINVLSDHVTLETENSYFKMSGNGDSGKAETIYEKGQIEISTRDNNSEGTYSFEYLIPFLKTVKDNPLIIEYSSSKPIRLDARFSNIGRLHYYLAPRIET